MTIPAPPIPPGPAVRRLTADGKPTTEQVLYEQRVLAWMKAVAAALPTGN